MTVFLLLIAFFALGAYFHYQDKEKEKARIPKMEEVAERLNFHFQGEDEGKRLHEVLHKQEIFKFSYAHHLKLFNIMKGKTNDNAMNIMLCDCSYITGSGKSSTSHRISLAVIASDKLMDVPDFCLRPETFGMRVEHNLLSVQDIDFPDFKEFSRLYELRGENEPAIRDFFNADLFWLFESMPDTNAQVSGDTLIFFKTQFTAEPEAMEEFLSEAIQLYESLEQSV